jgi:hypothetical protein
MSRDPVVRWLERLTWVMLWILAFGYVTAYWWA